LLDGGRSSNFVGDASQQVAPLLLIGEGSTPRPLIDQALDFAADQIGDHGRRKRVQLPALFRAEAFAIAGGTGVALLDKARRRAVAPHLLHVQGNAADLDISAGVKREPLEVVAGAVGAVRVGARWMP